MGAWEGRFFTIHNVRRHDYAPFLGVLLKHEDSFSCQTLTRPRFQERDFFVQDRELI